MSRLGSCAGALCAWSLAVAPASAADPLIAEGWRLIQAHRAEEAARLFQQAAERDPEDILAHRAYQIVMANLSRHHAVQEEYRERALAQAASAVAAYLYSSVLLDDDHAGEAELERARASNPPDERLKAALTVAQAVKDIDRGRAEGALEALGKISLRGLALDAQKVRYWGLALLGRYAEAGREIESAIESVPFDPLNHEALAWVRFEEARFDGSVEAATRALELRESATARCMRGAGLQMIGQAGAARAEFRKARRLPPLTVSDYGSIGLCHGQFLDGQRMRDYLREASRRSVWAQPSAVLAEEPPRARKVLDRLLKVNPRNMGALLVSGMLGKDAAAACAGSLRDFDAVLKINPRSVQAWAGKIAAAVTCARAGEALEAARAALELAPENSEMLSTAGEAHRKLGRHEEAERLLRKAASLDPDNRMAYQSLEALYRPLRRRREADAAAGEARRIEKLWEAELEERAAEEQAKAAKLEEYEKAPSLIVDLAAAPEAIRDLVGAERDPNSPWDAREKAREGVRASGPDSAAWLARILLAGSEDLQLAKSAAATLLAEWGRWEDLLAGLRSPGGSGFEVAWEFQTALKDQRRGDVERHLPEIEGIARTALDPGSRAGAMDILAATRETRYAAACTANLAYSTWLAKAKAAGPGLPRAMEENLGRLAAACPRLSDFSAHRAALECLETLEDPQAIPSLLAAVRRTSNHGRRAEAVLALSKVAKVTFGKPSGSGALAADTACGLYAPEAWELAASSGPPGDAATGRSSALAGIVGHAVAGELAGTRDEAILDSWDTWWRAQAGKVPARYDDRVLSFEERLKPGTGAALYSSGKVVVRGLPPGYESSFDTFDDFEQYVKEPAKHRLESAVISGDAGVMPAAGAAILHLAPWSAFFADKPLREVSSSEAEVVRWLKARALPALRKTAHPKRAAPLRRSRTIE